MTDKKKQGRPLKEAPSNSAELSVVPESEEVVAETPRLNDTAYGLTKLPGGQRVIVRIKYDAVSGLTNPPEISIVGDDLADAEERLKITLAQELFR